MKQEITNLLKKVVKQNYNLDIENIKLTNPPKWVDWDFSINAGFLARDLRKNPKIIAEELKDFLEKQNSSIIENISILNWFLNIKVNKNAFTKKFLKYINSFSLGGKDAWKADRGAIIIDYIWANVW